MIPNYWQLINKGLRRAMDKVKNPIVAAGAENKPEIAPPPVMPKIEEIGGPKGPEPTRYGDWERNGRVSDF